MPDFTSTAPGLATAAGAAQLLLGWLGGAAASWPLEWLLKPPSRRRAWPAGAWLLQLGLWTLLFGGLLLVSQRPLFAAALGLAFQLLVILVNNAKYRALQEPFLFSDFGLFSQALRHPRLYLPFLGVGPALGGAAAILLSLYLGLSLESALPAAMGWPGFLLAGAALLAVGGLLLALGTRCAPAPSLLPHRDLERLGLAASLWLYWWLERRHTPAPLRSVFRAETGSEPAPPPTALPDIVAIQSESFCDARRLLDRVRPELLRHFDRACSTARLHGRLAVPAWGANTMRTEFGFLTGIAADALGVHRFNPYRRYARQPLPSLAACLKALGYRTLCIHPHPVSFFARDRVYPQLGFDEFIDIRQFDATSTCGPYISDAAVSGMIRRVLEDATTPLFVFVITMENHGPLHLEQVTAAESAALYTAPPPAGFGDLSVYLRHLANADAMIGELTGLLTTRARPGLLCFFGDHVPSMPDVYAATAYRDGRTDYFVWQPGGGPGERRDLAVEQLGPAVLHAAGLAPRGFG